LNRRDNYKITKADASSPVTWKWVMPGFYAGNSSTWNRYGDLAFKQELGPADLCERSDPDHVLTLVRSDTGRYLEGWQVMVDKAKAVVTAHPHASSRNIIGAGDATSTTLANVSGVAVGDWLCCSGGVFAKVTSLVATTATMAGGWVYSDGTAAPTPAQWDDWFVGPYQGQTSSPPGATTITDTTKAWTTNLVASDSRGQHLVFCGNAFMVVTSNSATVLTGSGGWQDLTTGAATATPSSGIYYVTGFAPGSVGGSWDPASFADSNMITGAGMGGLLVSPPVSPGYSGPNTAGGRAANFSWAGGTITSYDRGGINHALAVMGNASINNAGLSTAPATAPAPLGSGIVGCGYRIGIPNTAPNLALRPSLTTAAGRDLFDCLMNYGMFMCDFTGGFPYEFTVENSTETSEGGGYWVNAVFPGFVYAGSDWAAVIAPILQYTTDFPL
jgi:hypothetical protein